MTDPLADGPFSWSRRGDDVEVRHRGRPVTVLRGDAAARFLARVTATDAAGAQQLMARETGNFRRGNERGATRP